MGPGSLIKVAGLTWADTLADYVMRIMMTYLTSVWKLNLIHAAGLMNVYEGVTAILPIAMYFLVDSCVGNYWVLLLSTAAYSIGLSFLSMSTPPVLGKATGTCSAYEPECIGNIQSTLFYTSLALVAVGKSGQLVSLRPFATEQGGVQEGDESGNCCVAVSCVAVFLVPITGLIALGYINPWSIRFGIAAICTVVVTLFFVSGSGSYNIVIPDNSLLTRVVRVIVASTSKIHLGCRKYANQLGQKHDLDDTFEPLTTDHRYIDNADVISPSQALEEQDYPLTKVEETKITLPIILMWMAFIPVGLVLSIGNTYFVEQASHLNPKVGLLKVPLPILLIVYDSAKSNVSKTHKKHEEGMTEREIKYAIQPVGIGLGMFYSILCCIIAALVEHKRINVIKQHGLVDKPNDPIPMTMLWLLPQFLLLGMADGFARVSIESFFHSQIPTSMTNYMTKFSEAVFGAGIISGVLSIYIVGKVTGRGGRSSWFGDTLNQSRLDNYYWTLAVLSSINLVFYVLVVRYAYTRYIRDKREREEATEYDDNVPPSSSSSSSCCCY